MRGLISGVSCAVPAAFGRLPSAAREKNLWYPGLYDYGLCSTRWLQIYFFLFISRRSEVVKPQVFLIYMLCLFCSVITGSWSLPSVDYTGKCVTSKIKPTYNALCNVPFSINSLVLPTILYISLFLNYVTCNSFGF